jgi:hypothetical protein
MNRIARLVLLAFFGIALCAVIMRVSVLVFTATPQLRLLGFTSASNAGTVALVCLRNEGLHTIYLAGSTNGVPFYTREAKTPSGWQAIDTPARPMTESNWGVTSRQSCAFSVPVMTNQQDGWRVTVRYFDGAEYVWWKLLPRAIRLPWKGSGQYRDVSTDTLMQEP